MCCNSPSDNLATPLLLSSEGLWDQTQVGHSLTKERPVRTWPVGSMGACDQRKKRWGVGGCVSRGVPLTVWKLRCQLLSSSQVGLFVDFFARLFTQLKFGVVQACILYKGHSVPQHVWLLTLLSHTEMSLQT